MNKLLFAVLTIASINLIAGTRINETLDESRQRHQAEQYQQYKANNYQEPLGGYTERLSDPAPKNNNYNSTTNKSYNDSTWQDRAKR